MDELDFNWLAQPVQRCPVCLRPIPHDEMAVFEMAGLCTRCGLRIAPKKQENPLWTTRGYDGTAPDPAETGKER